MKFLSLSFLFTLAFISLAQAENCFEIDLGGWALNGHEQKNEAERLIQGMNKCKAHRESKVLYIDRRDSGAIFKLNSGFHFELAGKNLGDSIGIMHTQDWIQIFKGDCQVQTIPREIKPNGMKTPTAQVLKCSEESDSWGRKDKKLAISK